MIKRELITVHIAGQSLIGWKVIEMFEARCESCAHLCVMKVFKRQVKDVRGEEGIFHRLSVRPNYDTYENTYGCDLDYKDSCINEIRLGADRVCQGYEPKRG